MNTPSANDRQEDFLLAFRYLVIQELELMLKDVEGNDWNQGLKRVEFIARQCDHCARACHAVRTHVPVAELLAREGVSKTLPLPGLE